LWYKAPAMLSAGDKDSCRQQAFLYPSHLAVTEGTNLSVKFLSDVAKWRKATISFIMSVRLSVNPHGTIRLPIFIKFVSSIFKKSMEKLQIPSKSENNNG